MMVIVNLLQQSGFFQYIAIIMGKKSKGNVWHLLIILSATTSILSMFLDNVTTVVLIAPVTILIAEMLNINPVPLLLAEAMLSNIGGMATLVGDPPNVIIASASKLSFMDFLLHLGPFSLVTWIVAVMIFRFFYSKELSQKPKNIKNLLKLDEKKALKDKSKAKKALIVLALVIIFFFLHGVFHLNPALIALIGASIALLWIRPDMEHTIHQVEWNVLLFFCALFICVGGLKSSGFLNLLANNLLELAKNNLFLADMLLLWIGAIASGIIDNIPFTIAMVPVIHGLGDMGIHITSLWWALALGVGLGGNATPIGATANVIVVSLSEKTKHPITFKTWITTGIIVTLCTCIITTILFAVFFGWMNKP
jgi:Na+/H+ antiporter NhaD/arsenite permease-like protein